MLAPQWIADSPEDVGIDSDRLQLLFAAARREVDEGRIPSAQIALACHGRLAGMASFGNVECAGVIAPTTDQTLFCVYSTTKGIIAAALWLLMEEDLLRLDERVSDIIPEFASNGKDVVSVRHVVTHTCGFPLAPMKPEIWDDRDQRLATFAQWRLTWEPDSRFEYHATSAHWVLAEIIERRTGQPYQAFVRQRIIAPMGLDEFFLGLPAEQDGRVAKVVHTVPPVEPPGGWGGADPDALLVFNRPAARRVGVPGGGAITSAAELAMLYQPLVHGGVTAEGKRILRRDTIEQATRVLTDERHVDPILRVPVNRAVGVVVAGDDGKSHYRGFGHKASAHAFGHGGAGGQIAWGDPQTGLSVGFCSSGLGPWVETGRRVTELSTLAAECVVGSDT